MPHDAHGNELKVGDIVSVRCKVKAIHLTEEYCNVDLETTRRMWPTDQPMALTLNSKQTERAEKELLRGARVFLDWLFKRGWVHDPNAFTLSDPKTETLEKMIAKIDEALG